MKQRFTLQPQTLLIAGVILLLVYFTNLLLLDPPMMLGVLVIILVGVFTVTLRYISDISISNDLLNQISEIIFYAGLASILGANAIFIIVERTLGEYLYALSIILFCLYIILPGLEERLNLY